MQTNARLASFKHLLCGALALPMILAACAGNSGSGETPGELDDALAENGNDKIAFDYFVSKGLSHVQAAGIVGNLDQESGMSPTISQYGGGPGRGIAQWSAGGRWDSSYHDNVSWYAADHGASRYSLDLQLEFIWYELTTYGYGFSELRAATTVDEAVLAFQDRYEICGACDASNRIAHAEAALADFGGGSSGGGGGGGTTMCSVDGVSGACILTSACASKAGHVSTPGHCPGAADVECCTAPPSCNVNGVSGLCIETSVCATMSGHHSTPGHCPGSATEECCTK